METVLQLQQKNGHFGINPNSWLISDLAAITILTHFYQLNSRRFQIRLAIKRVLKAVTQLVESSSGWDFDPILSSAGITEVSEIDDTTKYRLNKTVLLFYFSLIQGLCSKILPRNKYAASEWVFKAEYPCFTFSQQA